VEIKRVGTQTSTEGLAECQKSEVRSPRLPINTLVGFAKPFCRLTAYRSLGEKGEMNAIFDRVLTVNLIANTAIFYVAARLYLLPLVPRVRPQQILVPILLLHSTRHLGLMFLTRGATFPGTPPQFAYPAAFGDLITAILAFAAIPFVLRNSGLAKLAAWVFNIVGTLDLLDAITLATIYNALVTMGPAYWIPAFWVPLLLVTHYVTFVLLGRRWQP
jgi:hypothetical protein